MLETPLRVGIIGLGNNTRLRHLPGLRAQPGVEIRAVCNRTRESSRRAAEEFGIPRVHDRWEDLAADPDIDAVVIGTWPYLHCPATCAALAHGKHVLTEARMACNAAEARQMAEAAAAHPELTAMVVPSPFGLAVGPFVRDILDHGYLGQLREMVVIAADDQFWDASKPRHWRQDAAVSGLNVLALGIMHETALRWSAPPVRVFAQSSLFSPTRPDPEGGPDLAVTVPDSVQVVTRLADGANGIYHISGAVLFGPGRQIHLYGSRGTIKVAFENRERVFVGRAGDEALREAVIPESQLGGWRVEEEFVQAIRGREPVRFTDFKTGLATMEFTEAVHRSAAAGRPVDLPLGGA